MFRRSDRIDFYKKEGRMKLSSLFSDCLSRTYTTVGDGVDYAVEQRGSTLYLWFEESSGLSDWQKNLNFPARAYRPETGDEVWLVHRGFHEAWTAIEDTVAEATAREGVASVVTVGYSHGAALALLCHEYIWYHRLALRPHLLGFGFGCPRVLWGRVSDALLRRWQGFTRVSVAGDPVTHLPPSLLGYRHVGKSLVLAPGKYGIREAHRPETILRELFLLERAEPREKALAKQDDL